MESEILTKLESEIGEGFPEFSIETLADFEEYLSKDQDHRVRGVVLASAVHFTPRQALEKKTTGENPEGQYENDLEPYMMIEEYLLSTFDASNKTARRVSQKLGKLWDDWIDDSRYISYEEKIRKKLRKEQNNKCKNCNSKLEDEEGSIAYQEQDDFKPIHEFARRQTAAELDHIEPLSHFGSDRIANLQILCRFCNQGKGNRIHVPITQQIKHAHKDIEEVPKSHRREVFFSVTNEAESCSECGSIDKELTIQLKNPKGCYVVSNLDPICTDCRFP